MLIGNLYYDRRWWTDALREYRFAVMTEARTRSDAILLNNTIRCLGERATYPRARRLLVDHVGRAALPALHRAAKLSVAQVRKRADELAHALEKSAEALKTRRWDCPPRSA